MLADDAVWYGVVGLANDGMTVLTAILENDVHRAVYIWLDQGRLYCGMTRDSNDALPRESISSCGTRCVYVFCQLVLLIFGRGNR